MEKTTSVLVALAVCFGCAGVLAADAPAKPDRSQAPEATTYQIRNVKHQDLLRPKDASAATGTPIVLYSAQPWKCMTWRLQPAGESGFHLRNLFTAKTFCASSNATASRHSVTQVPLGKDGGDSPVWQFTRLDDGTYKITDGNSGQALTAAQNVNEYEVKIVTAPWENLAEQKWRLEKMDPKQLTM